MKLHFRVVLSMVIAGVLLATAQTSSSRYDPAARSQPAQRKGFVESTLGAINPRDIDYGQRIEDARRMAIESTLESYYFWSNAVATGVAIILFLFVLYQRRLRQQIMFTTAELVTSYHNQLAVAEGKLAEVSTKYTKLMGEMERAREISPPAKASPMRPLAPPNNESKESGRNLAASLEKKARDDSMKPKQPPTDMNDTITSLRQQLSVLTRKLEEEQQKNRRLSGG